MDPISTASSSDALKHGQTPPTLPINYNLTSGFKSVSQSVGVLSELRRCTRWMGRSGRRCSREQSGSEWLKSWRASFLWNGNPSSKKRGMQGRHLSPPFRTPGWPKEAPRTRNRRGRFQPSLSGPYARRTVNPANPLIALYSVGASERKIEVVT